MKRSPSAGYREIDHTADLGFEVWAPSWEELVATATPALAALCYDVARVRPRQRRPLHVTGVDREELLVRWLQEVYLLLEIEGWLTVCAEGVEAAAGRLDGVVVGEPLDRERHTIHTEIKAITYHHLRLQRDAEGLLRTWVIVDV